jgi:HK97 family phage portal protein
MGIFGDFIGRIHKSNDITSVFTRSILPNTSSTTLDTKDAPPFSSLLHEPWGGVGKPSSDNKDFQKLYSISAPIYRAVQVIANNISMLPVRIMDGETDVTDNPEYQLFKTYNNQQTHFDFWEQTIGFLELTGEAFWLLDRDGAGKVISAYPIRPDLIEVVPSNQFVIDHYLFNKSGKAIRIESEDMFFLKYYNPTNHIRGLSPIAAAESDIILELNAVTSSKSLFERGAQPSGIISTDMDMSQGDWERTRGYISKEHVGADSKGKIMFLTHGLKWQQMQLNQRDMQYMEQRQWTKDTVSEVYGIPPVFLMQFKEASVIANADVQYRLLWDTLKPKIKRIEQIITEMFMPNIGDAGPRIEFDLGNISALQPDIEKMADRYRVGFNMGAVSPNDFREDVLGMDRVEDEMMDGHFVGSTMLPIGEIGTNFEEPEKSIDGKLNKIDKAIEDIEKKSEIEILSKEINLTNQHTKESEVEIEKQQIHRALLRIQRRVSAKFEKATVKLFKKQQAEIIANFGTKSFYKASAMNVGDVFDFDAWVKEFEALGEPYIMEAVALAAEEFARSINGEFFLSDPRVAEYVGTRTTEYATIVNQTTKERIDKLLKRGAAENLTMNQLGSSIESYFKSQTAFRAARIARTEVVSGTNYGRFRSMKQSDRVENHMWVSQRDGLVRDTHTGVDGEVVKVGNAFNVPPGYMGDASYPSDINERCFTLPVKADKKTVGAEKKISDPVSRSKARSSWGNKADPNWENNIKNADRCKDMFGNYYTKEQMIRTFVSDDLAATVATIDVQFSPSAARMFINGRAHNGTRMFEIARNVPKGSNVIHHGEYWVHRSLTNKSFMKQTFRRQLELYRRSGFKGINTYANIDVGGYAWGKYGFDAGVSATEMEFYRRSFYRGFLNRARGGRWPDPEGNFFARMTEAEGKAWVKKMKNTPVYEFAHMGSFEGVALKRHMLGMGWDGYFDLTNDVQWRIAMNYCVGGL